MSRVLSSVIAVLALAALQVGATAVLAPSPAEANPRSTAVSSALSRTGAGYQWGGNGPRYDCSGLVQEAYRAAGVSLPRTSEQQFHATTRISRSQLRPGDLVFWHGHVEMYVGNGQLVGATRSRGVSTRALGAWRMDSNVRGYGRVSGAGSVSSQATASSSDSNYTQLLRSGSRGPAVRAWQAQLRDAGYTSVGPVDGIFGPLTRGATVSFQRNRGILVDGIVGPQTRGAMR